MVELYQQMGGILVPAGLIVCFLFLLGDEPRPVPWVGLPMAVILLWLGSPGSAALVLLPSLLSRFWAGPG
jgi:hypothetical protein